MGINKFLSYLNKAKKPLALVIFLVFAVFFGHLWLGTTEVKGETGVLGGPSSIQGDITQEHSLLAAIPLPSAGDEASSSPAPYDEDLIKSGILEANPAFAPEQSAVGVTTSSKKSFDSAAYFIMPTTGLDFGKLHPHNAVDIANSCGTPVNAAAEGLVSALSLDSWSGGYGHYVMITHPNGIKTRYAHLTTIAVSVSEYVKQGQRVGLMGRTGDATGCHLHFEVLGAPNPFVK
jgi:murein DD-endopeptidase MepM/ murein hydrolase activator NlpD